MSNILSAPKKNKIDRWIFATVPLHRAIKELITLYLNDHRDYRWVVLALVQLAVTGPVTEATLQKSEMFTVWPTEQLEGRKLIPLTDLKKFPQTLVSLIRIDICFEKSCTSQWFINEMAILSVKEQLKYIEIEYNHTLCHLRSSSC